MGRKTLKVLGDQFRLCRIFAFPTLQKLNEINISPAIYSPPMAPLFFKLSHASAFSKMLFKVFFFIEKSAFPIAPQIGGG